MQLPLLLLPLVSEEPLPPLSLQHDSQHLLQHWSHHSQLDAQGAALQKASFGMQASQHPLHRSPLQQCLRQSSTGVGVQSEHAQDSPQA
jgi:hypothetical protein